MPRRIPTSFRSPGPCNNKVNLLVCPGAPACQTDQLVMSDAATMLLHPCSIIAALVLLLLASFVDGTAMRDNVPRALRQTTRDEVIARMRLAPDGSWTAKRSTESPTPLCVNDGNVIGGGYCGCTWITLCGTKLSTDTAVSTGTAASFTACITSCDDNYLCESLNYDIGTSTCTLYKYDTASGTPNANYDAAYFNSNYGCPGC